MSCQIAHQGLYLRPARVGTRRASLAPRYYVYVPECRDFWDRRISILLRIDNLAIFESWRGLALRRDAA